MVQPTVDYNADNAPREDQSAHHLVLTHTDRSPPDVALRSTSQQILDSPHPMRQDFFRAYAFSLQQPPRVSEAQRNHPRIVGLSLLQRNSSQAHSWIRSNQSP